MLADLADIREEPGLDIPPSPSRLNRGYNRAPRGAQGPLDRPRSGDQDEALLAWWFADDVQGGGQDSGGPVDEAAGEAGVGEDVPDRCGEVEAERGGLGAVAVLDAGGADHDDEDEAEGVGDDGPFAAVDVLAGVVASAVPAHGVGGLDALRVDDPGGRLPVAALLEADLFTEVVQDALGDLVLFPADEVPVDGLPWREVGRELPPGAAGTHDVEDRVHDRPAGVFLWPATGPGWWEQASDVTPLGVGQIGGIPTLTGHAKGNEASTVIGRTPSPTYPSSKTHSVP
ncbi:hypothetical protein AAH979_37715 [Plantactinospora sp. ZYX-F-223]|uniref:hypothetical protein n=1 Tax=Plantactinospora sp. ZYX-F-223 TaxID=3144103 RepID=UPI0031FC3B9A